MTAEDRTTKGFWQRPLVIPPELAYRRDLGLTAEAISHERIRVIATLDDAEHHARLVLEVDTSGTVQVARFTFEGPFHQCAKVRGLSHRLIGATVQRDVPSLATDLVGGHGCFHALELASSAFHFATNVLATARVGWDVMHPPRADTYETMRRAGCDRCLAFQKRPGTVSVQIPGLGAVRVLK